MNGGGDQDRPASPEAPRRSNTVARLSLFGVGGVFVLMGAYSLIGGIWLVTLGGAPGYIFEGLLALICGVQLIRRRAGAVHLYWLYLFSTWIWALTEVGLDGWALLPRVDVASLLLPVFCLKALSAELRSDRLDRAFLKLRPLYLPAALVVAAVLISIMVGATMLSEHLAKPSAVLTSQANPKAQGPVVGDWKSLGHDPSSTRFSPLALINVSNVKTLKRAWDFVEPLPTTTTQGGPGRKDEETPLELDGKLITCLPDNTVLALDAENGRLIWRHTPHVATAGVAVELCRGVAFYEDEASTICPKRLLIATVDARMLALNSETGAPCADFGDAGEISLKRGLGPFAPGLYYSTSPPTIVGGLAVVGALVKDNVSTDEPSGVIRAFNARSGKLAWAWDMGRSGGGAAEVYTRGTPNAWTSFSADEALGLVFVPTGNATPDFIGAYRPKQWEPYSSAVVALDGRSGQVRWVFQTTHHDLWDYDLPAQPLLLDWPTSRGPVPALIQATKRGQIFVLDRRNGAPLAPVDEELAPKTDVPGEMTAKTQPWSRSMPDLGGPPLREIDMWGMTPFDQLWCRIAFHSLRYDGPLTPPSLRGSIVSPGMAGGQNWGGVAVDLQRRLLIAPSLRLAYTLKLEPRSAHPKPSFRISPMLGTPYFADNGPFLGPLQTPCQRPPYALITAVDLLSHKVIWQTPLGTAEDLGPRKLKSNLPITIGAPPLVGGAITTAGGLIFIGAAGDNRLRALNTLSGRELWSDRLPEGDQATPMTYRSPSGRQMLIMVSGGWASLEVGNNVPTHIIAYALPSSGHPASRSPAR